MTNAWVLSALWVGLALIATLLAIWFRIATALSEIVVGTVAQLIIGAFIGTGGLQGNTQWITYLAGTGAIVLTFLAGAELDPVGGRFHWAVSRLHPRRALRPGLEHALKLAVWRCSLNNVGCRRLCRHAGVGSTSPNMESRSLPPALLTTWEPSLPSV